MAKAKYAKGKDGYYRAKVWDGTYCANGTKHRINVTSKKSSGDLERKVNAIKQQVENREYVVPSDMSFQDYARSWLVTYKSVREKNTYKMYENIIEKHMQALSSVQLKDISREHIQLLINDISGKPRTCQQLMLTIKQVVKSAVKSRKLPAGALELLCDDIDLPKYIPTEKRALTNIEINAIKKADFSPRERCFVLLIYGCGLRREEALAITPADVSFARNELTVNKALCFDGNSSYIKGVKSANGNRTIPMPAYLTSFLRTYIPECGPRLVTKNNGADMTLSAYRNMWDSIIGKMNTAAGGNDNLKPIVGLTAHVFRHNYCTQLCYQIPTISTKKIAQLLGDSEKMVLEVYNHIVEDKEDTETAILNAVNL